MVSESKFVQANGLRLHYLDFGNPASPPIICLHGLSGNAHNFDGLAPKLAECYHVLSLDVRGRGESAWGAAADYNPVVYVADLLAFVTELGLQRINLIGTSMGGVISMIFAGGYPERVARLVLNDIGPEVDPAGLKRITDYFTEAPNEFATLADVAAYYRANYPFLSNAPEAELLEFVKWSVKPLPSGGLTWKIDPAIRNIPRTGTAARPIDLWVPYARIQAKILVIRGAESDILARATAERMRMVLPGTEVVEIPAAGHAPTLNEPTAVGAIVRFFAP
jgi:pimeloyl-ACP methyl ester carboxylesterase